MMLYFFAKLGWLSFHSMLGLGLCVFDVGVRVMLVLGLWLLLCGG